MPSESRITLWCSSSEPLMRINPKQSKTENFKMPFLSCSHIQKNLWHVSVLYLFMLPWQSIDYELPFILLSWFACCAEPSVCHLLVKGSSWSAWPFILGTKNTQCVTQNVTAVIAVVMDQLSRSSETGRQKNCCLQKEKKSENIFSLLENNIQNCYLCKKTEGSGFFCLLLGEVHELCLHDHFLICASLQCSN